MSDTLLDLEKYWQQHLQLILPVAGAVALVIAVFLCGIGSPSQPSLVLVDEPVSTKKEKALAKKKLKLQQQKKQKPSNGLIAAENVKPKEPVQPPTQPAKSKPPVEPKKSTKVQDKKSATTKKVLTKTAAKPAEVDEHQAAIRQEKAQMKKEAQQGDWVTVVSSKDKKAKQAQQQVEEAHKMADDARQAIIEEAKRLMAEDKAKSKATSNSTEVKKTSKSKKSQQPSNAEKTSKSVKSKPSSQDSKKGETSASNIPEPSPPEPAPQPDVRPKEPKALSSAGDQSLKSSGESEKSVEEKIEDAMQPAFDEMGEWEQAKPMKMKNVKKRARREK